MLSDRFNYQNPSFLLFATDPQIWKKVAFFFREKEWQNKVELKGSSFLCAVKNARNAGIHFIYSCRACISHPGNYNSSKTKIMWDKFYFIRQILFLYRQLRFPQYKFVYLFRMAGNCICTYLRNPRIREFAKYFFFSFFRPNLP